MLISSLFAKKVTGIYKHHATWDTAYQLHSKLFSIGKPILVKINPTFLGLPSHETAFMAHCSVQCFKKEWLHDES